MTGGRATQRQETEAARSGKHDVPINRVGRSVARAGARFRRAAITGAIALVGLTIAKYFGGVLASRQHAMSARALAISGAVVFLVFALLAVRSATQSVLQHVPVRIGDERTTALRIVCLLVGYVLVIVGALSALNVPVEHLVVGGVMLSVLAGIAAQQALGNVFAGLVLLVARPFVVGDAVVVRSGALGGMLSGVVTDLSLVHVTIDTDDGPVLLPNAAVLAAAIGPVKTTRHTTARRHLPPGEDDLPVQLPDERDEGLGR